MKIKRLLIIGLLVFIYLGISYYDGGLAQALSHILLGGYFFGSIYLSLKIFTQKWEVSVINAPFQYLILIFCIGFVAYWFIKVGNIVSMSLLFVPIIIGGAGALFSKFDEKK